MKKIASINQYLLERHPSIWNTKMVWMLLISIFIHLLFFGIGYVSHINPKSLQTYNALDDYFTDGIILVHIIISVLLIVGWLVLMFKNNAFKNYYPVSRTKLFGQFVQYFIIFMASTTFYFSYMYGFKLYITKTYDDTSMQKDIATINQAYPFLSRNLDAYTLNKKRFPDVFTDLYCETDIRLIDRSKKYFVYRNRVYQFYSLRAVTSIIKSREEGCVFPEKEQPNQSKLAFTESTENSCTYYFKVDVIDVSPYVKTNELSYYNFSQVFYTFNSDTYSYRYSDYPYEEQYGYAKKKVKDADYEINKSLSELLDRNNPEEIRKLLNDFLLISQKFKIETNLTTDGWFKLIYHPKNFEVKRFIKENKEYNTNYYDSAAIATAAPVEEGAYVNENGTIVKDSITIADFNPAVNQMLKPEDFYTQHLSDFYYYDTSLKYVLQSVDRVKETNVMEKNIHIYIWISFVLAVLVFSFRVTNLRALLFSIITAGVLSLIIGLFSVIYSYGIASKPEYFAGYVTLLVGTLILLIPIVALSEGRKLFYAILMNISMNGFVLYVFLIMGLISMHQSDGCYSGYDKLSGQYVSCDTLLSILDINASYVLLLSGFLFMFLYTGIIRKWKALPE